MQKATIDNLPFIGQIVRVTMRDGREFNMKICQELPDNDSLFSIMIQPTGRGQPLSSVISNPIPVTIHNKPPPPPPSATKPSLTTNTVAAGTSTNTNTTVSTVVNQLPTKPRKIDKNNIGAPTDANLPFKKN